MMAAKTVTAVGNAGFCIKLAGPVLFVDAFYRGIRGVADSPWLDAAQVPQADVILVTHAHPDHFDPDAIVRAASRTGAVVVGPHAAMRMLGGAVPAEQIMGVPGHQRRGSVAWHQSWQWGTVSAVTTVHGKEHVSYLLEAPGLRLFHDGDNEDTRCLPPSLLGRLDLLLLGPWQGSGWVEWIDAHAPVRSVLMHLTEDERNQHAAGRFLPDICDHVPRGLCVLAPGESIEIRGG